MAKAKKSASNRKPEACIQNQRHSLAHILAEAVLGMFPEAKLAIGPPVDDGFYYDFELPRSLVPEDLPLLEERMLAIIKAARPFEQYFEPADKAIAFLRKINQPYKVELAEELAEEEKEISFYRNGDFIDMCCGPHVPDTSKVGAFKLTHIAGAYWRGDANRPMLQRIYGVAFPTRAEVDNYLRMLEEAKKRDHRKLGKDLSLFTFSALVGAGLPLFLPKGAMIKYLLEEYMREEKQKLGYKFVWTPHIARTELYKRSGHLGKYDAMMPFMSHEHGGDEFVMKAMNCPHHFEIYNSQPRSYRELPMRIAENTTVYRNEKSGEVSGLLRVRSITQDDTHHFVTHEQIQSEIEMIFGLMQSVFKTFGFKEYKVQISLRDPEHPEKYFGDDKLWKHAESVLVAAAKKWGVDYIMEKGEAAFYGPKIDIMVRDAIGRLWQLTTIQLDFSQPENFNMTYVGEDGKEHRPAVLHVAILGSTERFMGVLIEHFIGAFPVWLAPVQVRVIAVSDASHAYAEKVAATLRADGRRVELDIENASVGKKIRNAELEKVPYMLVVGEKEAKTGNVSVRSYSAGDLGVMPLAEFQKKLAADVATRSLSQPAT